MANSQDRIIIDTNLWISFLIKKDFSKLDNILVSQKAILIFSEELLTEFIEVVKRPKLKKYFSKNDLQNLLNIIEDYAEYIEITSNVNECRDEKDNFLLNLAKDGKVDYLITGDKDLLELNPFGKTKIVTITGYFATTTP